MFVSLYISFEYIFVTCLCACYPIIKSRTVFLKISQLFQSIFFGLDKLGKSTLIDIHLLYEHL